MDFAKILNRRRKEQFLSMDALAAKSNVSKSMISKIEAGSVQPTLDIATKLAHALGFQLSELLQVEIVEERQILIPRDKQALWLIPDVQASRRILSPGLRNAPLEWLEVEMPALASLGALPPIPRGEKYVYVEKGLVRVSFGKEKHFDLRVGDSFFFKADEPHEFSNPGKESCRYLLIILFR